MLIAQAAFSDGVVALNVKARATIGTNARRPVSPAAAVESGAHGGGLPNGINGRQLADAAREARPELTVLFVTGYAESALLDHGHLAPRMHVVTKPVSMETLATRIEELIGGA
jgi:CheY-like chemotaxis protein